MNIVPTFMDHPINPINPINPITALTSHDVGRNPCYDRLMGFLCTFALSTILGLAIITTSVIGQCQFDNECLRQRYEDNSRNLLLYLCIPLIGLFAFLFSIISWNCLSGWWKSLVGQGDQVDQP